MRVTFLTISLLIFVFSCKSSRNVDEEKETLKNQCSTIFQTVLNCSLSDLKKLIEKDNALVNAKDTVNHLFTPLFYAAQINHKSKFDYLLKNGAEISALTDEFIHPQFDVLYVALEYDSDRILKRIIELKSFDLNKKYDDCENVIYTAVRNNSQKCLKILLDNKVRLDVTDECSDDKGISPLGWAALKNHVDVAKLLIEYGANVNEQKNIKEHTILGYACSSKDASLEMVKLLVENGADIDKSNHLNFTPLMRAVASGKIDIVEYLITKNANINAQTDFGRYSPLHYACSRNNMQIVELLLENGANPDMKDKNNLRPIDKLQNEYDKQKMRELIK
ncbi:ankyrin repeat domain-containing protein [Robertkochia sediminum]|uniref:ankyrin repeat domain-containing protein n=1 Tax=Robertkochia sediminum TaxID=2785326 RepID=UPI00193280FC|nr:ankyrin repeat domain-containing protein [Robertkochia sediminum]MBL7471733.1 ankyrin repeat domain-containing protein [Robertkochia sediminum]